MAKTKADLHREWARVLDMCEGTEVYPEECCKFEGSTFDSTPGFSEKPESYEFAVAILESKPAFDGDVFYFNDVKIIMGPHTKHYLSGKCSWNPPKHNTFELNGIELPCPITGSFGVYLGFAGKDYFFGSVDDRNKVSQAIIKILDEAAI